MPAYETSAFHDSKNTCSFLWRLMTRAVMLNRGEVAAAAGEEEARCCLDAGDFDLIVSLQNFILVAGEDEQPENPQDEGYTDGQEDCMLDYLLFLALQQLFFHG